MKAKVRITFIAKVDARDAAGLVSSRQATATFDAELDWIPMEPGLVVINPMPNRFEQIDLHDEIGFVRQTM